MTDAIILGLMVVCILVASFVMAWVEGFIPKKWK